MKIIKWVIIVVAVLFVLKLGQAFFNGMDSTTSTNQMIQKAQQKAAENK